MMDDYELEEDFYEEIEEEEDCYPPDTLANLGMSWKDFV